MLVLPELQKRLNIEPNPNMTDDKAVIGFGENVSIYCDQIGDTLCFDAPLFVVPYDSAERYKKLESVLRKAAAHIPTSEDIVYLSNDESAIRICCFVKTDTESIGSIQTDLFEFSERVGDWAEYTSQPNSPSHISSMPQMAVRL